MTVLDSVEYLPIIEVKKEIERSISFLTDIEERYNEKQQVVKTLDSIITILRLDADSLSKFSDLQISRIQELTNQSINKPNIWRERVISFILGILASLFASFIPKMYIYFKRIIGL